MPNEFRSQSQMGGRVDYVKAGKPTFDLAAEAKKERAKMGGSAAPAQPASSNKATQQLSTPKQPKPKLDPLVRATKPSLKDTPAYAEQLEK